MSFVEIREYQLVTGAVGEYLSAYREHGYAIQRSHLGEPVGWYTTEIGPLNQIVHLWRYESLEDRTNRRNRLFADPDWLVYVEIIKPLIVSQTSRILTEPKLSPG